MTELELLQNRFTPQAIQKVSPGAEYSYTGYSLEWSQNMQGDLVPSNITWLNNSVSLPTKEEFDVALNEIISDWYATQYQRDRQPEYPPLTNLADALYWQSKGDESKMEQYLADVQAVKDKYPKGTE